MERYLRLGLALGRCAEGVVDSYYGPASLKAEIEALPPPQAVALVSEGQALLADLDDSWLRDQVRGVCTYAGVLAGEPIAYADEVEGCYGVRVSFIDEDVFRAAHDQLDRLLPAGGALVDRVERWRASVLVPHELVHPLFTSVVRISRAWTLDLVALPPGEVVELEIVKDKPWSGYNYYLGDLCSRVAVNIDLPMSTMDLIELAIHETYPGHHTEGCMKEHNLVRDEGRLEETIALLPTPASLISEGIAESAPSIVLHDDVNTAISRLVQDAGIRFDLDSALAITAAQEPCRKAVLNAALLLHDHGAQPDHVMEYLQYWGLVTSERAAQLLRFISDPATRAYIVTYFAGRELCETYVGADRDRLRRLLTTQVRVCDLLDSAALPESRPRLPPSPE